MTSGERKMYVRLMFPRRTSEHGELVDLGVEIDEGVTTTTTASLKLRQS
jgi:hypothetical protein